MLDACAGRTCTLDTPTQPKGSQIRQLGLLDGCIANPGIDAEPAWALFEFNIYLIWQARPRLEAGHTFSRNMIGAQRYVLRHVADERYPDGHEYLNPHGVWEMDPEH